MHNLFRKSPIDTPSVGTCVSMEEEVMMMADANEAANDAASGLAEVKELTDVSDGLEDLADVVDGIDAATDTDIALVETAVQMAVAGSSTEVEEVAPAMESFRGKKIATEGFRETASKIWETIKEMLKKVWERITSFFTNIFGAIPNLRRRIEALQSQLSQASASKQKSDKVSIKASAGMLRRKGKIPENEQDLSESVKVLTGTVKEVLGEGLQNAIAVGELLTVHLGSFDPAKAEDSITSFVTDFVGLIDKASKSHGTLHEVNDERWPKDVKVMTNDAAVLPGDVALFYKSSKLTSDQAQQPLQIIQAMHHVGTSLAPVKPGQASAPGSFEMKTMSVKGMGDTLNELLEMLKVIEAYQKSPNATKLKRVREETERASDKMSKEVANYLGKTEFNQKDGSLTGRALGTIHAATAKDNTSLIPYYRAMVSMNTAYTDWVQNPAMPLLKHAISVMWAVLAVVRASAAQYDIVAPAPEKA